MAHRVSHAFARDEVRHEVVPVYMGLIKQIDDQMGVLFRFLEQRGLFDNTLVVFTSDHGDYLGDHWLGEKEFFHEPSVKIPLIIYDPDADATRGSVCDELVEAIDLAPTFLDALGADPADQSHRLEGRSLMPLLRGRAAPAWRPYTISEYDYSIQPAAADFRGGAARCAFVHDRRQAIGNMIHAVGFRPMLFDLDNDPRELRDLGTDPECTESARAYAKVLAEWGLRLSQRLTRSEQQILAMRGRRARFGILIGVWDESDIPDEYWSGLSRRQRYVRGDFPSNAGWLRSEFRHVVINRWPAAFR